MINFDEIKCPIELNSFRKSGNVARASTWLPLLMALPITTPTRDVIA